MSDGEAISGNMMGDDSAGVPETSGRDLKTRLKSLIPSSLWTGFTSSTSSAPAASDEEREAYIHEVRHEVAGWNGTGAFRLVHEIAKHQLATGVRGDVAEIGVHHGQLLIFLMMLLRKDEHAIAIDLFEDQHLNIDGSGKGDREILMGNLERFCPKQMSQLAVLTGDSTKMKPGAIRAAGRNPVRLFSVDGGHTRDIVLNDLFLAADSLHEAGVVVADDVFNAYFPGVGEGLAAYISGGVDISPFRSYQNANRRLLPFAIGCNKVLLAFEPYRTKYAQLLEKSPLASCIKGKAIGWGVSDIPVFEM